ncbi:fad1f2a8-a1ba-4356-a67b-36b919004a08 [Sclerotinia trifoliorum]|uniref:Fad1f2a8-a1ba-4356-a67b-36b919004a08 n=1 Tax=Sclerotinia trifoliorum TaxID=28548 RepID=A0A8H2VND1_9HELO|nr:fad1f2a8-a1ba-4356-a67b-36b919004a08 [Sclerotinia trifoliorum]
MGGLCSRLDPQQVEIYQRSISDFICIIKEKDAPLAQLIEGLAQQDNIEVSGPKLKKILRHVGQTKVHPAGSAPSPAQRNKKVSIFVASFQE